MKPMLDDLPLPQVQVIRTMDKRALAEHRAQDMDGSLLQNLGRHPARVLLAGVASGPEAKEFIETLDTRFRDGGPVSFTADIIEASEIESMRLLDLRVEELAGKPERFAYCVTLDEFIEPVEPEETGLLDNDILEDAQGLIDDIVDGLDLSLAFPTGLERFVEPLSGLLSRLQAANQSNGSN